MRENKTRKAKGIPMEKQVGEGERESGEREGDGGTLFPRGSYYDS